MKAAVNELHDEFVSRCLPRREFIRKATMLGLSFPAALALLAQWSQAKAAAMKGDPIKIGALAPLSGVESVLGPSMRDNAILTVEDINKAGGVLGSRIDLIVEDTATSPNTAVAKARKLIQQDRVDVIVGVLTSAARWAVALQVTAPAKMIYINPTYYEGGICDRYFFNVGALPNQQINPCISWLIKNKHVKTFYLGGSDYAWPHGSFAVLKQALVRAGGRVVGEEYSPLGSTDFSATLRRMQAAKPDVIFPLYAGADGITFLKQLVNFGLEKASLVASSAISEQIVSAIPQKESTGWVASFEYFMTIDTPENRDWVRRYQARFGSDAIMDAIGEGMHTGIDLYVKGAEKARSLDRDAVVNGMVRTRFSDPKGEIHIDNVTHCAYLNDYIAELAPPSTAPAWQRLHIVDTIRDIKPEQPCLSKPPA